MSFDLKGTEDMSRGEKRELLLRMIGAIVDGKDRPLSVLSNAASFIMALIPDLNWAGFYFYDEENLYLGPFQGLPACTKIEKGEGVCGTAIESLETLVVPDVHDFPGHIACDSASASELVIPLYDRRGVYGVIDLDSPIKGRFEPEDVMTMEEAAEILLPVVADFLGGKI